MPVRQTLPTRPAPVKIWTDDVDDKSRQQLANIASLPFIHHHVAAMPDVHLGIGATIGSVIATRQAIVPAAVGVDIGCGMVACRLSLNAGQLSEKGLRKVFDQISHDVPVGREQHADEKAVAEAARPFAPRLQAMTQKHPQLLKSFGKFSKWVNQLGTLGSVSLSAKKLIKNCQSAAIPALHCRGIEGKVESITSGFRNSTTGPSGCSGQP
ncbi:MAG: hypothetical protein H6R18_1968 [Proteobacteria bacterium]|nr:hypothetical protein [Pseudomonadota bacterium]